jgi:hypothetical protein
MNENQVTEQDIQAVERLWNFYQRRCGEEFAGDRDFRFWVFDVLQVIRARDYQRVKEILENGLNGGRDIPASE